MIGRPLGHLPVSIYKCVLRCSVMSNSLGPHGLHPTRLLCPRGFSRQEYWSGLPCPPSGYLPNPGIEPRSPALQVDSLPTEPPGKPSIYKYLQIKCLRQYLWKHFWTLEQYGNPPPYLQADTLQPEQEPINQQWEKRQKRTQLCLSRPWDLNPLITWLWGHWWSPNCIIWLDHVGSSFFLLVLNRKNHSVYLLFKQKEICS